MSLLAALLVAAALAADPAPPTERVVPTADLFDRGATDLSTAGSVKVDQVAADLGYGAGIATLTIEVHTDSMGSGSFNLKISQARADALKQALADRGFARDTLQAVGKGETEPIASNQTAEGRTANQRVVFRPGGVPLR